MGSQKTNLAFNSKALMGITSLRGACGAMKKHMSRRCLYLLWFTARKSHIHVLNWHVAFLSPHLVFYKWNRVWNPIVLQKCRDAAQYISSAKYKNIPTHGYNMTELACKHKTHAVNIHMLQFPFPYWQSVLYWLPVPLPVSVLAVTLPGTLELWITKDFQNTIRAESV